MRVPGARELAERWLGLSARRSLPRVAARHVPARRRRRRCAADVRRTPTSCCSSTRSPTISSRRTRRPRSTVLRGGGLPGRDRAARPTTTSSRASAVLRPHVPRRRAGRRSEAARRAAWSRRSRRTSRAAPPIVGLEPSCLLSLRDEFLVMGLGDAAQRACRTRVPVRGIPGARAPRRAPRAAARAAAGDARAAARPLPSEGVRRDGARRATCWASFPASPSTSSNRAAAAWRAASATRPRTTTSRCRWRSWRCCRRCAPPAATR